MKMTQRVAPAATSHIQTRGMTQERLATIWSMFRRAEKQIRIYYRAQQNGSCRVFRIERVEELGE
jgi:hypothetical protein